MQDDDPDYRLYVPLIYEITYKLMFRLYNRHRDCTPGTEVWPAKQPEIEDMAIFVPQDPEIDAGIKELFIEDFTSLTFGKKKKTIQRQEFEGKFSDKLY